MVLVVLGLYMPRNRFRHTIGGLLAFAFATSLFARGQFWDFMGYTQVDSSQDHGRIQITRRDVHFARFSCGLAARLSSLTASSFTSMMAPPRN
jgi:hypothetical protein